MNKRWFVSIALILILLLLGARHFLRSREESQTISRQPRPDRVARESRVVELKEKVQPRISADAPRVAAGALTPEVVRSLRSIAKMELSGSYAAQKAYHSEYGRYTTDLKSAGLSPSGPELKVKFGFLNPFRPSEYSDTASLKERPDRMTFDDYVGDDSSEEGEPYRYSPESSRVDLRDYEHLCETGCTATESSFEILAAIPFPGTDKVDVWRINQDKELVLVHDGFGSSIQ